MMQKLKQRKLLTVEIVINLRSHKRLGCYVGPFVMWACFLTSSIYLCSKVKKNK